MPHKEWARAVVLSACLLAAVRASAELRLEEATIGDVHEAMTSGELTARHLVELERDVSP